MATKTRFERFRDRFLAPRWSRFLVFPGLAGAPTALVTYWFKAHSGQTDYFLEGREPDLVLGSAVWAAGIMALKGYLDDLAGVSIAKLRRSRDDALVLIGWIRRVVQHKSRRFTDKLESLPSPVTAEQIFLTITQPQQQIKKIVEAIAGFYSEHAEPGEEIDVLLMRWTKGSVLPEFFDYFPDVRPNVRPDDFRDTTTAAGRAYLEKTLVICEELHADSGFKRLHPEHKNGSMFAFPVEDDAESRVVFVVNVLSATVGRFQKAQADEDIRLPMEVFAERLMLEERLLRLKERVAGSN